MAGCAFLFHVALWTTHKLRHIRHVAIIYMMGDHTGSLCHQGQYLSVSDCM